jgi:hypothetical protein
MRGKCAPRPDVGVPETDRGEQDALDLFDSRLGFGFVISH